MTQPKAKFLSTDSHTHNAIALSKALCLLAAALVMTACSGGKVVKTVDNSADYQSARSLPPLKKPDPAVLSSSSAQQSQDAVTSTEESVSQENTDSRAATLEPASVLAAPDSSETADSNNEDVAATTSELAAQPDVNDLEQAETPPSQFDDEAAAEVPNEVIAARVEARDNGTSRLVLEAPFENAWPYLVSNLQSSDITVFSRNKAAGRFAIGCGDIDSAPQVEKRGGWSFINRKKEQQSEYCALQVLERKGATSLIVLNRSGREVGQEYSEAMFNRLLNN